MRVNSLRSYCPAAIVVAFLAGGCGGGQPAPASNTPPPNAKRVDESKAGQIAGRVLFEGPAPENPPIKMASDPVCIRENTNGKTFETVLVNNRGLDNVFVYVKDGLGNYYFDTPTEPVRLDQSGCRYTPHVFGVRVGQPLEISNSDATMHNVHAIGNVNQEFNFGQHVKGQKNTRTFTAREVMVTFKCNVHPWMHAYAGVLDHPYFAVATGGGKFELKNVPAGTYTVEAWHEKLGAQTQSVTLGEKEAKEISFTFRAEN
jgi:plastocyanin